MVSIDATPKSCAEQKEPLRTPSFDSQTLPLLGAKLNSHALKKTLVLDVDETLCHATTLPTDDADFTVCVRQFSGFLKFNVRKRPFVDEFLAHMGRVYEVVFFSSANEDYSNKLLDRIDT